MLLTGEALGLARNSRCETLKASSTFRRMTAGPAQYANTLCSGRESKALLELVVVPMTDLNVSCQPLSFSRFSATSCVFRNLFLGVSAKPGWPKPFILEHWPELDIDALSVLYHRSFSPGCRVQELSAAFMVEENKCMAFFVYISCVSVFIRPVTPLQFALPDVCISTSDKTI